MRNTKLIWEIDRDIHLLMMAGPLHILWSVSLPYGPPMNTEIDYYKTFLSDGM